MRKQFILILRLISCVYVIYLTSSICVFTYMMWDGSRSVPEQLYYIDSLDMQTFCNRYQNFCLQDSVEKLYTSPYNNTTRKIQFVKYYSETTASCNYYSKKSKILLEFCVKGSESLCVSFYGIELPKNPDSFILRRNINDGSNWMKNKNYLNIFEQEVLSKICTYEKDVLQGLLCWYANFFERNILFIVFIGIVVITLLRKGRFGSGDSLTHLNNSRDCQTNSGFY